MSVPDYMEPLDWELLQPVLEYLGLRENIPNEFQMSSPTTEKDLRRSLAELGLVYDEELQGVVDEMGAM